MHVDSSRRCRRLAGSLCIAVLCAGTAAAELPASLAEAALELSINTPTGGDTLVLLRDGRGQLWLDAADYSRLRLQLPSVAPLVNEGRQYYPLSAIDGAAVLIDEAAQHVTLSVPATAFGMTRLSAPPRRASAVTLADPGAFLNYQLAEERIAGSNVAGALLELGGFAAPGALISTFVARSSGDGTRAVRLDTAFTHDFAERLETLSLGDAVSDPGGWGVAVRYAGVRWARNFAIRPDLVTTPLLTGSGSAVVPSTVDVFVNNQRLSSAQVPAGPFVVDQLPAVSGSGDVRVVVRDALGHEQVLTQSFYSGASLLARGFSQYSLDLGRIREAYALDSFHYGRALAAATYRRGLTDALTLEGHGEFLAGDARALGLGLVAAAGRAGTLTTTLAAGGDRSGQGLLTGAGFERRARAASVLFSSWYATPGYRQVGDTLLAGTRYARRTVGQVSVDVGRAGTLALAEVAESFRGQAPQKTVSFTHTTNLGPLGSIALTLNRTRGGADSRAIFLGWTLALGERRALGSTALAVRGAGASTGLAVSAMQNPPVGPGSGWRFTGTTGGSYDADWRVQYERADFELESARSDDRVGIRAYVRGAATLLDGELRPTRSVSSSFAVVDVGGIADVPVYLDNQLVAHTDSRGRALLHNLRAYEDNRVSIEPEELPIDTGIGARTVVLTPANRSGVVARFPIERIHAGTFRLLLENGGPVPAGAHVELNGEEFPVARDGLTYVTTLGRPATGSVIWDDGHCQFLLPVAALDDPLPDLGDVRCRAVP